MATQRLQIDERHWPKNIWRLCGGMKKFGGYSIGIAQTDDEIKEKSNFRNCPNSNISLLVSRSDMPNMRRFSIGGLKNQHDNILESFGTTEQIIISLIRLPSTTYSPLFSPALKILNFPLLFLVSIFEIIPSQILTEPQNRLYRNYFMSSFDLAAKRSPSKIF